MKKKIIIILITIILINLFTNYNYLLNIFNKSKILTYTNEEMIIENNSYEILNINEKINLVQINFETIPNNIEIHYTNEDFSKYYHYNSSYYKNNIKNNQIYIPTSINGNVKNLKININGGTIDSIVLNPKIKLNINIFLNIKITLIVCFIYFLITNNNKLNAKKNKEIYCIFMMFAIIFGICIDFYKTYTENYYQFGDLYEYHYTNAIKNKQLNLNIPVSDELENSDNPYDTSNRAYEYYWDASYYNGKYYCYFGIWPIISLFIPYNFITNNYLTTPLACFIYCILSILGTFNLYNSIIKKYFKNIKFETYIISFLFIIFGSKILWCMHRPCFYELVSLAAYANITFGLNFVLFSNKKFKNFIGYSLLALAVLCRPTTLLCSILILPKLFYQLKKKQLKIINFIILIIPYTIVGIFTMYINYIRFDSIFEFGISYQLTTNNLYNYNFSLINSIYGLFTYLFGKINLTLFPLNIVGTTTSIPIITDFYIENIGGGVFTTSILGIIILFIPKIFKYIKEKELKTYIILSLILANILILLSSGIGALIGRYMLDFNYLFYFIITILSLYLLNILKNINLINTYKIIAIISIFINYMLSITN